MTLLELIDQLHDIEILIHAKDVEVQIDIPWFLKDEVKPGKRIKSVNPCRNCDDKLFINIETEDNN